VKASGTAEVAKISLQIQEKKIYFRKNSTCTGRETSLKLVLKSQGGGEEVRKYILEVRNADFLFYYSSNFREKTVFHVHVCVEVIQKPNINIFCIDFFLSTDWTALFF
jgi:hypothetical protein